MAERRTGGILSQLGGSVGGDPSESPNFYVHLLSSRELLTRLLESKFPNPRTDNPRDSAALIDIMKIRHSDPQRRMELAVKQMTEAIEPGMDTRTNLVWFTVDARWGELTQQSAPLIDVITSTARFAFRNEIPANVPRCARQRAGRAEAGIGEQGLYRYRDFLPHRPSEIRAARSPRSGPRVRSLRSLDKQLEVARIDEINDAALITIIDSAIIPRKALWPRYWVTLFTATAVGLLVGLLLAGSSAIIADWRQRNPESWEYLSTSVANARAELKSNLGLRRKRKAPVQDLAVNTQRPA